MFSWITRNWKNDPSGTCANQWFRGPFPGILSNVADIFSPEKRSEIMRNIKPWANRSTELRLACAFRKARIVGWRRHTRLLGRPDFTFHAERVVVFVDGDFWHGHPRNFKVPGTNASFWVQKIRYNRAKDRRVTRTLREAGWTVIRIWESSLKKRPDACLSRVLRALENGKNTQR